MGSRKSAQELQDEARKLRKEALEIEGRRIASDEVPARKLEEEDRQKEAEDGAQSELEEMRAKRARLEQVVTLEGRAGPVWVETSRAEKGRDGRPWVAPAGF